MKQRHVARRWFAGLGRDPFVQVAGVVLLLSAVPYVVPVLSAETMSWFSDYIATPPLLALGVAALLYGLGDVSDAREREFWQLLAATLALDLVVLLIDWMGWDTDTASLVEDVLYVGSYIALLMALSLRPDRTRGRRRSLAENLEITGTLVFVLALLVYYVVIPVIWTRAEYESWVPSLLLYGTLDCFVVAGVARLWWTSRSRRWRTLYGFLLWPTALWLVTDFAEGLGYVGVVPYLDGGTFLDFAWLAPVVLMVPLARMRALLPAEPLPAVADSGAEHEGHPSPGQVMGYAVVFSGLHYLIDLTGVLGPVGRNVREVVVLASLPVLLGIAYALDRALASRARALDERGQHLERQLQESQRMEALGTLAGGIAHEFNNLLTVIIGFAQLHAEELAAGGETSSDLAAIVDAAERGRTLTGQILAFSRRQEAVRRPVDLCVHMEEAVRALRVTLPASVKIELDVDPDAQPVWADAQHIHQIVLNLATNANHAMGGTGVLEIGVFPLEAPPEGVVLSGAGPCTVLRVRDDGAGMDTVTLARIFEPFYTTKQLGRGTGLGLAVVQGIVAAHGGGIQVDSEPGGGTEFRVYLPVYTAEAETWRSIPGRRPFETSAEVPRGRVLVVDDEPLVAEMTCRSLASAGFHAVASDSAKAALNTIEVDPSSWDVVVADQSMPERTGLELAAELERRGVTVPVVLLTDFPSPVSRERAQSAGVADVVAKPFTGEDLIRSVRQVVAEA